MMVIQACRRVPAPARPSASISEKSWPADQVRLKYRKRIHGKRPLNKQEPRPNVSGVVGYIKNKERMTSKPVIIHWHHEHSSSRSVSRRPGP